MVTCGGAQQQLAAQLLARLVGCQVCNSDTEQWTSDVARLDAAPALAAAAAAAAASCGPSQLDRQLQPQQHSSAPSAALQHPSNPTTVPEQLPAPAQQPQPRSNHLLGTQRLQGSSRQLLRPAAVSPAHLRELLQQQITCASCWQELQELLLGRRQVLTLKHLAYIVKKVCSAAGQAYMQLGHKAMLRFYVSCCSSTRAPIWHTRTMVLQSLKRLLHLQAGRLRQ